MLLAEYIDNELSSGTGFLVAPNLMLTAAHVIYDQKNDNNIRDFVVQPGYNYQIYQSCGWQTIYRSSIWLEDHNYEYDWALVELDKDLNLGYWGSIRYETNDEMKNLPVRALGYPTEPGNYRYQYYTTGKITDVETYRFVADAGNENGMSGGPISLNKEDNYDYAIGLVSQKIEDLISVKTYGVKYTEYMTDLILSYIY